jgi:hypothetical protein
MKTKKPPVASDLEVLRGFDEPFEVDGLPRDRRMALRWGCTVKEVYGLWDKKRFKRLIEYGVSLRTGWLTEEGRLTLRASNRAAGAA